MFDRLLAALGLFVIAPVFALVALVIKLGDGGPVFYRQQRIGKGLRPFSLIKFRTMTVGADRHGLLTLPADPRVTRVGRILRRSKLDELPQLINVLRGEMRLVGPRPEIQAYVSEFTREYAELLQHAPGLTDPAAVAFAREEELFKEGAIEQQYISQILPQKLSLSLDYQKRRNWLTDLHVLLRTTAQVVKGAGLNARPKGVS